MHYMYTDDSIMFFYILDLLSYSQNFYDNHNFITHTYLHLKIFLRVFYSSYVTMKISYIECSRTLRAYGFSEMI